MNADRGDDTVSPDDGPVRDLSYMAASRELDGIVEFFEKSDVDVDQLVARLERATAIVDELDRRIRRTRAQVEELVPKLEAAGRTAGSAESSGADDLDAGNEPSDPPDPEDGTDTDTLPF